MKKRKSEMRSSEKEKKWKREKVKKRKSEKVKTSKSENEKKRKSEKVKKRNSEKEKKWKRVPKAGSFKNWFLLFLFMLGEGEVTKFLHQLTGGGGV